MTVMKDQDPNRRTILKEAGALAAAGALGGLAGCTGDGDDGGGSDGSDGGSDGDGADGGGTDGGGGSDGDGSDGGGTDGGGSDGGGSETITVDFWTFLAAENNATQDRYPQNMSTFESQHDNVEVNLNAVNSGDLSQQLPSAVQAGNAPDLAESGAEGITFWQNENVADHNAYMEETGLPSDFTEANLTSAEFRGDYWSGGGNRHLISLLSVRTHFFKDAGVESPEGIETWTDFRRALDTIAEDNPNVWAYEETGVGGDLESYWGYARTAHTDGKDPWIRGDPSDPNILIGEEDRTDGMIKNCIDLADTYSSNESAGRSDEEMPSLLLTDQAASFLYGLGSPIRYRSVRDDVTFGWDGDIWQGPHPRLDANYGEEFGIDELAGHEGQHGGHLWSLEFQLQAFDQDQSDALKDAAFDLMTFVNTSEEHNIPLLVEDYPAVGAYEPVNETIVDEFADDLPQVQQNLYTLPSEFGSQYNTTGAAWDVGGTSQIRWTDINETISEAIAGQHTMEETPGLIRERVQTTLDEQNF
jgi:ABC-type glycerol-3-phosphate transport system substrate-binding protein